MAAQRLVGRLIHLSARFTRPMTLGVRAAILDADGGVMLVRHSYVAGWHLPGGAVEAGEAVGDALVREAREECNVEVLGPPDLHGVFFNRQASRRDHVIVYAVRRFRLLGPHRPNWEIVEAGRFAVSALPHGTTPATRARLAEIVEGRSPAPQW